MKRWEQTGFDLVRFFLVVVRLCCCGLANVVNLASSERYCSKKMQTPSINSSSNKVHVKHCAFAMSARNEYRDLRRYLS